MVVIGVLSGHVFMMVSLLGSDMICSNILCTTGSWPNEEIAWDFGGIFWLVSFFSFLSVHN